MTFCSVICTEQLLNEYVWLRMQISDPNEFIHTEIVVDAENYVAVLPERYSHADYPDRGLTCVIGNKHFRAIQRAGRSDEENQIEITFEADTSDADCRALAKVL